MYGNNQYLPLTINANPLLFNGGSVGIGTTAPTTRFSVAGGASETTALFGQGSTVQTYIGIGPAAAVDSAGFVGYDIANNYLGLVIGGDALGVGLNIKRGGSVGIGTISPSQRLEVVGAALIGPASGKMFIGDVGHGTTYPAIAHQNYATTTGYALLAASDGHLFLNKRDVAGTYIGFRKANGDLMVIDNNGNVGINTTSPTQKLEVKGSAGNGIKLTHSNNTEIASLYELSGTQGAGLVLKTSSGTQNIFRLRSLKTQKQKPHIRLKKMLNNGFL
jgi:hypothetical protein